MADKDDDKGKETETEGVETELTPSAEDTIIELKKKLELSEAARIEAERRAKEGASVAVAATAQADDANLQMVAGAIDTLNASQDTLEQSLITAHQNQDFASVARIQREMAKNATQITQLEAGKQAMEEERKRPKRPAVDPADGQVERLAKTLTPKSAAWVRANPEYVTNPRKNRKMIRAHEDAIDEAGLEPDSDDYFEYVEKALGMRNTPVVGKGAGGQGSEDDPLSDAGKGKQRVSKDSDTPPPALPAGGGPKNSKNVRLTPEQKEMAKNMGMTDEEYGANLTALRTEGRLN